MARIVQKFGGTSVGDMDRIRHVAGLVKAEYDQGNEVVVVPSAMSGITDGLVDSIHTMSPLHDTPELDVVTATGELVTFVLLSLALQNICVPSLSRLARQVPLHTAVFPVHACIAALSTDTIFCPFPFGLVSVLT